MIDFVREGDVIVVHSMDRLGRNLKDLLMLVDKITSKGVTIHFVKENISLSGNNDKNPMNKLLLGIMGSISEFERELILERQKEGIELGKLRGVYKGRKPIDPSKIQQVKSLVHNEHLSVQSSCNQVGISPSTYYKYIKKNPF